MREGDRYVCSICGNYVKVKKYMTEWKCLRCDVIYKINRDDLEENK